MNPDQSKIKQQIALTSLAASGGLAIAKFVAAFLTGSLGLLSEALHSLVDFFATILTWFTVRWSDKPADDDHHYGHAKLENVSALAQMLLLLMMAGGVAYEAVRRLQIGDSDVEFSWWVIGLLLLSIAIDFNRSRALLRVAHQTKSSALAADALHFSSDMWSSAAVIIGLILVLLGFWWGDSVAALIVSGMIAWAGASMGWETLSTLVDTAPQEITTEIQRLAENQEGVLNVSRLRVRPAGAILFVGLIVDVPRTIPVTELVTLKSRLEARIKTAFPEADVTITANPVELDSETAFDKISLVAAHHGLAIHHLLLQDLDGKMAVSFDLEVDGELPLVTAHQRATELEVAIRDSLGVSIEVESHIEPLPSKLLGGRPANSKDQASIEKVLSRLVAQEDLVRNLHSIRIRDTDAGIAVHYHCHFPPTTSVFDVHKIVDRIEDGLKLKLPQVWRVVAHAEPSGVEKH